MENLIVIKDNAIEIFYLEKLYSFSSVEFQLKIKDINYTIKGIQLELLEINQDAKKLVISGKFESISQTNTKIKDKTSFIKKLFS